MSENQNKNQAPGTLPFNFVPQEAETAVDNNPHEKATTQVDDTVSALEDRFGEAILEVGVYAGERTVRVETSAIVRVCTFLRDDCGYNYLSDLGGADRFTEDDRFEVFYNLVNITDAKRIRLAVRVDEEAMNVASLTEVYPAAGWNERECFDMFGITFDGHPDMRRMFMPEDFEYHPLRKEFPLLGVPGSLPLPPQAPTGDLTMDPFPAAHGHKTPKSFEEVDGDDGEEPR